MNNLGELTSKIEQLIESEKSINPDIQYLNKSHSFLIAQIISNYKLHVSKIPFPHAQMIFLGAPTGAGKDTLVRKIMADNPTINFVVLNMDIFRHYHNEISPEKEPISDKDFARKTNQTSYELYYIIQEIILREFPGTNVIVTGTMRDLDWVKDIIARYKQDTKTNYNINLTTLAVPINESAFSIFERYLNMVDTRDSSSTPLRYTDLDYHNDTVKKFVLNVQDFENNLRFNPKTSLIDSIKIYRRNKDILNLSENNLIYDSNNPNSSKNAVQHIYDIMYSSSPISDIRISKILDIIKRNESYLKSQGLYKNILTDLKNILPSIEKSR